MDDLIEVALQRLLQDGPVGDPQSLRDLLPEASPSIRQYVLTELVKLDMALSAEAGALRPIESYLDALADLMDADSVPFDLVLEEIQLRKELGETSASEQGARRFPQFASVLGQLAAPSEATAAVAGLGAPAEFALGNTVDDFLVLQKLGQGAFAHVYLARQVSMHRLVALKVSRGNVDEPQALAQFDHPNIVRVFDQRTIPEPNAHLLYMQFHPGGTLADVVQSLRRHSGEPRGDLLLDSIDRNLLRTAQVVPERSSVREWIRQASWPTVVAWIGVQLARALDAAHDRDVLHRDVKPANVLLSAEGIPKLADFNVSFAGAAGRAGAAASFGGSIGYMSPEHLRAIHARGNVSPDAVRESADLYSLAVLLWELWQGYRPFDAATTAGSWSEAVDQQLESRQRRLIDPPPGGTASARVLEKSLRSALAVEKESRPGSGAEMAARLRLALHPDVAGLFDPDEGTVRWNLWRLSTWPVAGVAILTPNIAAGVFNYFYNRTEILDPNMRVGLGRIALCVNLIAYPLAIPVMFWFTRGVARALQQAEQGAEVSSRDIRDTLNLGHYAALIGGFFWAVAGVVYPIALWSMYPDFTGTQAFHFFVSLLICGGVAMIYPFFAMALVSTLSYYPRMLTKTMQDPEFDRRAEQMTRRSGNYLLIAAIIPLLGAVLLLSGDSASRGFILVAILAGIVGLLGSFFAYRTIVATWGQLGEVLSSRSGVVPQAAGDNDASGF